MFTNKRQVDPKSLKKRVSTDYVEPVASTAVSTGGFSTTVPTATGSISEITSGSLEVYTERMMAGTVSNTYVHGGKQKVIVVVSGKGKAHLKENGTDNETVQNLSAGSYVVLSPNLVYKLSATEDMVMIVSQEEKYSSRLQMVDMTCVNASKSGITVSVTTNRRPGKSKAAAQQAAMDSEKTERDNTPPVVDGPGFGAAGLNPKPSLGRFDEDGAG